MPTTSPSQSQAQDVENLTRTGHEALRNGNIDSACDAFENAVTLANQLKEGFTERACYFNLGASFVARGNARKGIEFLQKALPPDKEEDGGANFADLHYNLGIAYDSISEIENAAKCYEIAVTEYRTQENKEMLAETLMKLGVDCTILNEAQRGSDFYRDAAEVFQDLKDQKGEVLALSSRVNVLAELKDIENCGAVLKILIDRCEELSDNTLKGKIYNDMGLVYHQLQHHHNAADCFELALELELPPVINNDDTEQKQLRAVLRQNLGAVYNQMTQFEKALQCHQLAVQLHGEMSNRAAQGQTFCNMGFAYSQMGDFEKSAASFLNAIQAAEDSDDKKGHWQASEGFAAVSFLQGQYGRAVEYYKNALTMLSSTGVVNKEHNERIVSKLADSLQCQLMLTKKAKKMPPTRQTRKKSPLLKKDVEDSPTRRISRTRPRPENHRLIARGIDGDQTPSCDSETDSGSTLSVSSEDDSVQVNAREKQRYVSPKWERKGSKSRKEVPRKHNSAVEVHSSTSYNHRHPQRTLPPPDYPDESLYEQPVDGHSGRKDRHGRGSPPDHSGHMVRSHREAYLASLALSQPEINGREHRDHNMNESRTCVIQ